MPYLYKYKNEEDKTKSSLSVSRSSWNVPCSKNEKCVKERRELKMWREKQFSKVIDLISVIAITLILIFFMPTKIVEVQPLVEADDSAVLVKEEGGSGVEFDLSKNMVQTKEIHLASGTTAKIVAEPVFDNHLRLGNGVWNICYYSVIFNCGFNIRVSSNSISISSAYDPWYYHVGVSVKSSSLKRDSTKQATYYFEFGTPIWDFGGWSGWLRASINSSNNLVVTVK
ncbi:DUF5626 family protein [Enterococcus spodopteracolus]|uniref:DUF5626 family protein n=1 Tax=Enterococcus spodopteracolus TaxID=3034501 RepID=UPI002648947C|nr:DUF5626 family protein [Enterococcus spodopteracolus]